MLHFQKKGVNVWQEKNNFSNNLKTVLDIKVIIYIDINIIIDFIANLYRNFILIINSGVVMGMEVNIFCERCVCHH